MASSAENFWQAVEKVQDSAGPGGALVFILFFAIIYFGIGFLAAWVISTLLGTGFWMTLLALFLLKIFL